MNRDPELFILAHAKRHAAAEPVRLRAMLKDLFTWEGTVEHPRWHTGTFWSQEDVRRYSAKHVKAENAKEKRAIFGQ